MQAATSLTRLADTSAALAWLRARGAVELATDSRRVRPGEAFIAWPGYAVDGRLHVASALAAGAAACLVEADGVEAFAFADERIAAVAGLKAATGEIASRWFDAPSEALDVVAVTGTNGKTSTAWWIAQALEGLGRPAGIVGTLGVGRPPVSAISTRSIDAAASSNADASTAAMAADPLARIRSTGLTTPDPVTLQRSFRGFVNDGVVAAAVEASSIGLEEHRLDGTRIAVAVYTNFTQDHLDYHGTMSAYWAAKAALFAWPGLRAAVLNLDDTQGAAMAARLSAAPASGDAASAAASIDVWGYSTYQRQARLLASRLGYRHGGLCFTVVESASGASSISSTATTSADVATTLIGDYNASNLLAVIGALRSLGVSLADAADACSRLTSVPGRMQTVQPLAAPNAKAAGDLAPLAVVDYAHTPDALEKALQALRPITQLRGGRLWCVFGCGGDRDAGKRPLMGEVAHRLADRVVVTSDNPRSENPSLILRQIAAGFGSTAAAELIEDRRTAVAHAVLLADPHDVVLIAGKGHELEQEIAGVKHPFSDVSEAQAALARRARERTS
ncbi:MAG: UDP-N-acetylmuramoyl-L-alanyl-D-glutamate--2,6-diaminopimelate ligase [Rhizobacter sp.]|nr:UDP-N-acetylmuramoyl-L-alanyl-D-glutamate--2,6-diaminopimelate ligase [Rhizobacter sp.]